MALHDDARAPEAWLAALLEEVAASATADTAAGPLRYRCGENQGFWEIDVYPSPVELIGGAQDGEVVEAGFTLDVEVLLACLDRVEGCTWHSLGFPGDEGPRLVLEGVFRDRPFLLQVLAHAPLDEPPGLKVRTGPRPRPP